MWPLEVQEQRLFQTHPELQHWLFLSTLVDCFGLGLSTPAFLALVLQILFFSHVCTHEKVMSWLHNFMPARRVRNTIFFFTVNWLLLQFWNTNQTYLFHYKNQTHQLSSHNPILPTQTMSSKNKGCFKHTLNYNIIFYLIYTIYFF